MAEVYRRSFNIVKKEGIVVTMVENPPDQDLVSRFNARSVALTTVVNRASLFRLSELVDKSVLGAYDD